MRSVGFLSMTKRPSAVSRGAEPLEFLPSVLEVLLADFRFKYFFYDRKKVGQ